MTSFWNRLRLKLNDRNLLALASFAYQTYLVTVKPPRERKKERKRRNVPRIYSGPAFNPTKTTNTAAYAAVLDSTSISFSRTEAIISPKAATNAVVEINPV